MNLGYTPRILIADDFATTRHIIVKLLAEFGYENTVEAPDGRAALAELERNRYDLLVADDELPGLSGIELVEAMRLQVELQSVRVLLVVGEAERESLARALRVGVQDYIVRPFTAQTLKDRIDRIFERTRCAA